MKVAVIVIVAICWVYWVVGEALGTQFLLNSHHKPSFSWSYP